MFVVVYKTWLSNNVFAMNQIASLAQSIGILIHKNRKKTVESVLLNQNRTHQ